MSFVTGLVFEASRDCAFDDPSWSDVESSFRHLEQEGTGTLTLEGPKGDVRLIISLARSGRMSVNWHSEQTGESFVIESDAEERATEVDCRSGESPARQFVEPAVALQAARTFFDDGARDRRFCWAPDEAIHARWLASQ
jgi:hypothetical protein